MEIFMEFDLLNGRALLLTPLLSVEIRRDEREIIRPRKGNLADEIRQMLRFRRKRETMFGAELFADPVWDMILDLCLAHETGKRVSVSSLCLASAVPATTALRWIKAMEDRNLVIREEDPDDRRRYFLSLAPDVEQKLQALLRERFALPQIEPLAADAMGSYADEEPATMAQETAA
jgi:DNA-binding MarR family transcriptional regulator